MDKMHIEEMTVNALKTIEMLKNNNICIEDFVTLLEVLYKISIFSGNENV